MTILQLHNATVTRGGGEVLFEQLTRLLRTRGIETHTIVKYNEPLTRSIIAKSRAFATGIYSPLAAREVKRAICEFSPDLLHVHGLYPLLSPSVLRAGAHCGVPVVLHCHSWHLVCPTGVRSSHGRYCDSCAGGREYFCALNNCRSNIIESIGYSIRSALVRKLQLVHRNVTRIIACASFAKQCYVEAGFDASRIDVLPNMVAVPQFPGDAAAGRTVLYVGRISHEKGIATLIGAASRRPDILFQTAGSGPLLEEYVGAAPHNVVFLGHVQHDRLAALYRSAAITVVPSDCGENGPLVVLEAMSHGVPVIASRVPGPTEIVDDGVTGLLFSPGDVHDLTTKILLLWNNPDLRQQMGQAGRRKVVCEYSEDVYFFKLMKIYNLAMQTN